ncbi:hypothetical protein BW731_07970 [Vagococcus martis]|uniref:Uncharacterized protein n=1 Tax=Vagococcus martis TaxID=1768210 RepID=A0A1V4DIR4_9ENTE|nr:hypothetical protein BW731_07970 [Vagococcus martis]
MDFYLVKKVFNFNNLSIFIVRLFAITNSGGETYVNNFKRGDDFGYVIIIAFLMTRYQDILIGGNYEKKRKYDYD